MRRAARRAPIEWPGDLTRGRRARRSPRGRRRGAVLLVVMLCLFVILLLGAMLMRLTMIERAQERMDERRLQAEWLAESGLERAWAKLAHDRDYAGDTWTIPPGDLSGPWGGRVRIEVERIAENPNRRRIHVRADYPADATLRARRSKQITVELGPETAGERR